MIATTHGYNDIINLLLKHKANPNCQDFAGNTALMLACLNKQDTAIATITENSKLDYYIPNKFGNTPMKIISQQLAFEMDLLHKNYDKAIEDLGKKHVWIPKKFITQLTDFSSDNNRVELLKRYLEQYVKEFDKTTLGRYFTEYLIHFFLRDTDSKEKEVFLEEVKIWIDYVDLNVPNCHCLSNDLPPMGILCKVLPARDEEQESLLVELANIFIEAGANPELVFDTSDGKISTQGYAAFWGSPILKTIFRNKNKNLLFNYFCYGEREHTLLGLVIENKRMGKYSKNNFDFLLEKEVNPNLGNPPPILLATLQQYWDIVQFMVENREKYGIDINVKYQGKSLKDLMEHAGKEKEFTKWLLKEEKTICSIQL